MAIYKRSSRVKIALTRGFFERIFMLSSDVFCLQRAARANQQSPRQRAFGTTPPRSLMSFYLSVLT